MAMMGDGRTAYDSATDGRTNRLAFCESDFRNKNVPTKGRISYYRETGELVFKLQTKAWDQWDDCFSLTGVKIPQVAYLGFTSVTGEVHDNHDIISVTTTTLGKAIAATKAKNTAVPPQKKSGVMWYFQALAACGVFVALVMAFKMSRKSNNNNMKRF
ncbi:hypothetical protein BGW38_003184 [Lunasporangiospora selenospora]|uniref:L-type lectin-like domain-containing protein n=1 Tax=Lunasporangiospora selenospora TaxID=979761 RepID=A0A9P6FRS1_9FUNG|nr:hypothetical protein BGW38_003184 [Lunasporangiospora selenospora]